MNMPYSTLKHLNPLLFALIHLNPHQAALIHLNTCDERKQWVRGQKQCSDRGGMWLSTGSNVQVASSVPCQVVHPISHSVMTLKHHVKRWERQLFWHHLPEPHFAKWRKNRKWRFSSCDISAPT